MSASPVRSKIAVALATVDELPITTRRRPDAERRASRVAARRAIYTLSGNSVAVELRRRPDRAPLARIRIGTRDNQHVAVSLTHCNGYAAAIAAPAGTRVGIDLERLDAADDSHTHYFLTARERRTTGKLPGALLWILKEAVWKALSLDSSVGFHELEIDVDDTACIHGAELRGTRYPVVASLTSPWPGYVMAAVHVGGEQ